MRNVRARNNASYAKIKREFVSYLFLSKLSSLSANKERIAILYICPAIVSGSGMFLKTHPVLFMC